MSEIIIDGVDVSGCTYYIQNFEPNTCGNAHLHPQCEYTHNCYYKQLKRAEQENEKLKEEILTLKSEIDYQININEQINRKYIDIKNLINKPVYLPNIEEQATNKYRQSLEDIREMCKRQDFNQGMRTFEILKVIDEVLND